MNRIATREGACRYVVESLHGSKKLGHAVTERRKHWPDPVTDNYHVSTVACRAHLHLSALT
jgi:hypothetical protein